MLSNRMRQAMHFAARTIRRSAKAAEPHSDIERAELEVLRTLRALPNADDSIVLRKLHTIIGMDQPIVLRAVRNLELRGDIQVETVLHDPLASRIALTGLKIAFD